MRADIRTLAIQRRRIVIRQENIEQLLVTDLRGIELHFDHFGVPGLVAANIFVGRVILRAAGVADRDIIHALHIAKRGLHAPETTRAKHRLSP